LIEKNEIISRKDIVKVVAIILSNWYLLIFIPAIAYVGSYIYTHRIPDVYAAKCQILLKSNETYDYQQQIYRGLGFSSKYANYEEIASQMRVLKSSTLIEEVLDKVPIDVSYFIIGRLKISEIYKHMPFKVHVDERSSTYSGMSFNLFIQDTNSFRLTYEKNGVSKDKVFRFGEMILYDGLYLVVEREENLNEVSIGSLSKINYMFKVFKRSALVRKYKDAINIENIDYTSIVEITLKDEIAEKAEEVLDTLAKIYVINTLDNKNKINENTLNYIDLQLDEVIGIINGIETELESFREEKAVLNLTREEESYYSRLLELEASGRTMELEMEAMEDLTAYLVQNEDVENLLPPNFFVDNADPELSARVEKLYVLREEYLLKLTSGTDANPAIDLALSKINQLKSEILVYVESQISALKVRAKEIEVETQLMKSKLKNIPKTQRQILNIERRLAVNEQLYSFLLSKRAETVIAKAGIVPQTKIIERARNVGVVYPDKNRMNLINLLIGLGVAVLVTLIKVLFFQKITTLGELQTLTSISILGSIPRKKDFSKTYRIQSGSERSDIVQAFRSLRTNLQYFSPTKKSKRILVTSILPGEGKTFTSVNLASILAIADKKVLLMDFDMHKPRLAKALELENTRGVSSFLIGQKEIPEIIQNSGIPTLDVITSGPVPPNASELVMREELNELFKYAEEHYDYVFLDTPPVTLITDGILLMDKVDVKLFVLNSKFTSKTSIDYIERLIESNDLSHCALILNEEKMSKINYYYSKYGYGGYGYGGYGYGYGYGETYGENK